MSAAVVILDETEAEIVAAEATAASRVLPEPLAGEALLLAQAAPGGHVPDELIGVLEQVASASLQGGRARRLYRAEGEKVLNRVLDRTPAGAQRKADLDEVNTALGALAGRSLDGVRVATRSPGSHTVRISADGVTVTLGLSGAGVSVESVAL